MTYRDRSRARKRGSAYAFVPTLLSGCTLWLRADLGVTLNGATVSAWANQGSLGGSFDQGTAANQPTYAATGGSNSQAALTFDGGDYLTSSLAASSWNALHSSTFTVFTVWRNTATGNTYYGICGTSDSSAASRGLAIYWDNRSGLSLSANMRTAIANGATYAIDPANSGLNNGCPANAWSICEYVMDYPQAGDDFTTFKNGASVKTANAGNAPSASNAANTLTVGCMPTLTSNGIVGGLSEVVAFNRTLSAAERARVRRYLGARYAITVT